MNILGRGTREYKGWDARENRGKASQEQRGRVTRSRGRGAGGVDPTHRSRLSLSAPPEECEGLYIGCPDVVGLQGLSA